MRTLTFRVTVQEVEIMDTVGGIVNIGQATTRRVGKRDPNVHRGPAGSLRHGRREGGTGQRYRGCAHD